MHPFFLTSNFPMEITEPEIHEGLLCQYDTQNKEDLQFDLLSFLFVCLKTVEQR